MNFRTSYLAGVLASLLAVSVFPVLTEVRAAEPLKITGPDGQNRSLSQSQYGPTTPQETFWSIAQRVRPDSSISIYQVMAAIYEANPHAFSGPNYNTLEKGMILAIPSKATMAAIPKKLAQQQAEEHDRAWRRGTVVSTAAAPKAVETQPATVVAVPKPPKPADKPAEKPVPLSIPSVDPKLVEENQALSSEITRLTEALGVKSNDVNALTVQVKDLTDELQSTKESLAELKLQNEQLAAENKELKQAQALAEVEASKPGDTWRTLMDNPLLLSLAAIIPALLVLLLIWGAMRRRRNSQNVAAGTEPAMGGAAPVAAAAVASAAVVAVNQDDSDEMAVHLDSADDESLDSLLDMGSVELKPEAADEAQDLFVESDDTFDEGQSLDDLWAEAMGESDAGSTEGDDLDTLMAGFSVEEDTTAGAADDDLDALMAGLSVEEDTTAGAADDDLDALMAGLTTQTPVVEEQDALSSGIDNALQADEDDLDALLASFGSEPSQSEPDLSDAIAAELDSDLDTVGDEADLDALLAEFDTPSDAAKGAEEQDLTKAIAAELDSDLDTVGDEADLDALLAEFDTPSDTAKGADEQDLTKAIAAELDSDLDSVSDETDLDALLAGFDTPSDTSKGADEADLSEAIAAELEQSIAADTDSDMDLDALLADFEAADEDEPVATSGSDNQQEDFSKALAAELDADDALAASSDDDLDALLSGFGDTASPDNAASIEPDESLLAGVNALDDIAAGLGDELPVSDGDDSLEALLAGFEQREGDGDNLLGGAALGGAALAAGAALAGHSAQDKPKASASDPVALSPKDSGFFNDLKGNKNSNVLEWEPAKTAKADDEPLGRQPEISDDDLLSAFAADDDDGFMLDVGDDLNMTVDEALAALDASEKSKRQSRATMDSDLTSFQKENGFIDIDKLLNDADDGEPEPYRELEMDMGGVESLIGNTAMVDVDDEENSVNAKLDLARAYIEIDDKDSAKALLREVEMDGNERQKAEAATLLSEIG